MRPPDRVRVAANELLAPAPVLRDELGPLQHRHVLLDGGEAHRVAPRETGHALLVVEDDRDDVPSGRVGEGVEDAVGSFLVAKIYNHLVVC